MTTRRIIMTLSGEKREKKIINLYLKFKVASNFGIEKSEEIIFQDLEGFSPEISGSKTLDSTHIVAMIANTNTAVSFCTN